MQLTIEKWSPEAGNARVDAFLSRRAFAPEAEAAAASTLDDIRKRGEIAILEAEKKFDGVKLSGEALAVSPEELEAACESVSREMKRAVRNAHRRVEIFAKYGMRDAWSSDTENGGRLGEFFSPIQRVGIYIPGGTAPLASTAVMTATLAKVAGVPEIVACTPCGKDGKINPVLLFALKLAGATEIYRIGGIQAIGLMAFGTKRVRPVLKIAGPGNAYVAAAKRQVYGYVAIDQVAGPSEQAVLADKTANPAWVAADLLSQAEHGSGYERAFLVTDSETVAKQVVEQIGLQLPKLSRRAMIERVIANGGMMFAVVPRMKDGVELVNRFAPEHLEILTAHPAIHLSRIRAAGAIFLGPWTPEPVGDFIAGPSHVLPTGGAARMFSGLTADDFRVRHSFVDYTKEDLLETRDDIQAFADIEGLDAHRHSAAIRFE